MRNLVLFMFGIAAAVFPGKMLAQTSSTPAPDCIFFIAVTFQSAASASVPAATGFDNRSLGCQDWTISYTATGTGSLTGVSFQSAAGASTAGSFSDWSGTVLTGINPNTQSSGTATSTFSTGCAESMACTTPNAWVMVLLTRGSFVGTIRGVLYGYRTGYSGNGGGGGGGGGCSDPCTVVQSTPANLNARVSGVAATGATPSGNPNLLAGLGGAVINGTVQPPTVCDQSAAVTLSSGTDVVIVPLLTGAITKICHVSFSQGVTLADVTIRQGTGSTCGSNTVALSGAYASITGLALDFSGWGPVSTTVTARDVCLHFSTTVTAGGIVTYAQR